jgi:hypothetical protein
MEANDVFNGADQKMIRVTFDHDYIDNLQDYYHRNECIREQQYLSQEKLLHLAAFCVSKAAIESNDCGKPDPGAPKAEAALDAVRQLLSLFEKGSYAGMRSKCVIVNGHANGERQDAERQATAAEAATTVEKTITRLRHLRAAARSAWHAVAGEN